MFILCTIVRLILRAQNLSKVGKRTRAGVFILSLWTVRNSVARPEQPEAGEATSYRGCYMCTIELYKRVLSQMHCYCSRRIRIPTVIYIENERTFIIESLYFYTLCDIRYARMRMTDKRLFFKNDKIMLYRIKGHASTRYRLA